MLFKRATFKPTQRLRFPPSSSLSMASLSSLFLSNPHHHRSLRPTTVTPPLVPLPIRSLSFSIKATRQNNKSTATKGQGQQEESATTPSPPEKKSFAVATGELFLGIASRIISRRANNLIKDGDGGESDNGLGPGVSLFSETDQTETWWRRRSKERIAPLQPEVVWEQRLKVVEAERGRKAVTSPGFSFSAAGL